MELECAVCRKVFKSKYSLKGHEKKGGCRSGSYECDVCPKILKNYQAFQKHKTLCANQFTEHKCLQCTKIFLDGSQLKRHLRNQVCTTKTCEECGGKFLPAGFYQHVKTHVKKEGVRHSCTECGKVFKQSTDLTLHSYIHSGEKPFPCKICGKAFRTPNNLKTHNASHLNERRFPCNLCDKKFNLKQTLRKHMETHFCVSKPHTCTICGLSFREKGNLKVHVKIHVKNEVINCPECEKSFASNANFKTHFDRVHNLVKPFECDGCNEAFAAKYLLTRHKKMHV